MASTITIHMVCSLDGCIEKRDKSVSWMEASDHFEGGVTLEDADVEAFLAGIDCYVMGARTYQLALELGWPYGDTPVVVLHHGASDDPRESVSFYSGDLTVLVEERLKPKYRNIWVVGGAMVVKAFIRLKLMDAIRLSVVPVILGEGTRLFEESGAMQGLHLKEVTAYRDGTVELWYEVKAS